MLCGWKMLDLIFGAAAAMKKRIRRGFCCCHSCKSVFDSEADFLLRLSCEGFCRGGANRFVREIASISGILGIPKSQSIRRALLVLALG